jgi:hypothetical protein
MKKGFLSEKVAVHRKDPNMPKSVRRFAYVALIIVLFGTASGWLGGV